MLLPLLRSHALALLLLLGSAAHAQSGTITVDGLERSYLVHLPSAYDGSTPLPLVVAMHGGFGSGPQLEEQSGLSEKAEEEGFIVVYPDGVANPLGIRTWNAGGCCGYAMTNGIDDVAFIDALLDTLQAQFAIDSLRTYATGMSNGGFMSYRLACELSTRFAAIAPVSATMTIAVCEPVRAMPVIALHSYVDTSVPYLGGIGDGVSGRYNSPLDSVQTAFALHAQCTVLNDTVQDDAELTIIRWHGCACGHEVVTYMTRDGGHSWPGGEGTGVGDPPSTTIDANDLMWDFFAQYTLDCAVGTGVGTFSDASDITLYPNPALNNFTVEAPAIVRVDLLDLSGRTLQVQHTAPVDRLQFDLGTRPAGCYVVRITTVEGTTHRLPLVIA